VKFLIDQDVYQLTVNYLKNLGHDVITVRELNMHSATDQELLQKARAMKRLFVTRDKDFGALVFLKKEMSTGVILLRGRPLDIDAIHSELSRLLIRYDGDELSHYFCVVERDSYRTRRIRNP
jgi:predicted nuclease of predicted toxin-antitoxin system